MAATTKKPDGDVPRQPPGASASSGEHLSHIRRRLLVLSGKGGVGKSTVAANLAVALALAGQRVGLLDVDIHGPSIPKLLHLEGEGLRARGDLIRPVTFGEGLKVVSIGFLLEDDRQAVIWRGPLKMKLIAQFLREVDWGELDFLVVDSPPGTGDEPLSVVQLLGRLDGAVVVTTPQELALADVRRCITFCRELGVPLLERIPLDPQVVQAGDQGKPFVFFYGKTETAGLFRHLAETICEALERGPAPEPDPARLESPGNPER